MQQVFIIDKEPKRDFTGLSLVLFILLSIFSMVASLDPSTRDEAAAKIVATLQVASQTSPEDDDAPPPVIVPALPQLRLVILHGRIEAPQSETLPHLQFESAFNPRGPPQLSASAASTTASNKQT